jgi:glucan biosynthesis protein C
MKKPRLFFIDNLRILLITQVMMIHLSITYGGEGSWYYKEGRADMLSTIVLSWHNGTVQAFSMGLFFLIAGYFTASSCDRKGARQFLKDRLLRLGIPLLCFDFVIGPLMVYPLIKSGAWGSTDYRGYLASYYSGFHIGTGPLWFVEALLIFAIAYVLWRAYVKKTAPAARSGGSLPSSVTIAAFAVALGAASFAVRIWLPIGWAFGPLNLQFPFFPQYICLFIVGIVAYRRNWLVRIPDVMGKLWLFVALFFVLVLVPVLFVTGGAISGNVAPFLGGLHWQSLAYAVWEQIAGVAIIIALLYLFGKYLNRQGKPARAASASAYTAYVIHAPVIILVAVAFRNINLYPLVKFALVVLVAVPLCFALSNVIRKLPLARRIL